MGEPILVGLQNISKADASKGIDNPAFKPAGQNEAKSTPNTNPKETPGATAVVQKGLTLKREFGVIGGTAFIVGTIIGSGIFASPKHVLDVSQSVGLTLTVWSLCGVLSILGALSYCELGTMIPLSGGEYPYLHSAFGPVVSFMFCWTSVIVLKPSSLAIICLVFGAYTLEPFFPGCANDPEFQPLVKLLASLAIGIITFVNCASVRWATRMQVVFTAAKLIALVMLIITGMVRLAQGFTDSFDNSFANSQTNIAKVGYAFYNGLWAYDGWNNLNFATEELKNPNRDLPLSILIGIPLVTGCYVLVNIAYFTVLSSAEILQSGAVAVTLANRMYGVMAWIIPVFVACSTFGAANGSAFSGGRLIFVAARKGHLPDLLAMIHTKRHTPMTAMLFNSFIALVMLIPDASKFETLINYFSFAAWLFYGCTMLALIVLRFRQPERNRPIKVWIIVPILVLLASIYLVVAPFYDAPEGSALCLAFVLSGIPFYLVFVKYKVTPKWFKRFFSWLTYKIQVILDVAMAQSEEEIAGA